MKIYKRKMTRQDALAIFSWKYPGPYDIYNLVGSSESICELLSGEYSSLYWDGELIGYYCTGNSALVPSEESDFIYNSINAVDIGLGMRPDLTGKGYGYQFVGFIISAVREEYGSEPIRLTVASFNKRAKKVYEDCGFSEIASFVKPETGREFIVMMLL